MTTTVDPRNERTETAVKRNHWRMIWAIARKDIVDSVSNSQLVVIGLMPVIIFFLYRLMVSGIDNSSILDIAVYDLGNSQLVAAMSDNPELELHLLQSEASLHEQINEETMSGLLIPANFDEAIAAGNMPELTIWINPASGMSSETVRWQRFLEAEIHQLGQQSLPAQLEWIGLDQESDRGDTALNSYLVIVILTMIFFMTGANLVAMLFTEEKEKKTAVMLINSPADLQHIVWGKIVAGTFYVLVVLALILTLNGGITGNWLLAALYLLTALPLCVGLGILIGSYAQTSKQCNSWLGIGMLFFLVPAWFSVMIEMPEPFASIFTLVPSTYFVQGLNDAMTHLEVQPANALNLGVWVTFMIVVVALAVWRVRQNPQSLIV